MLKQAWSDGINEWAKNLAQNLPPLESEEEDEVFVIAHTHDAKRQKSSPPISTVIINGTVTHTHTTQERPSTLWKWPRRLAVRPIMRPNMAAECHYYWKGSLMPR
mgnify:CR=1 FL=1